MRVPVTECLLLPLGRKAASDPTVSPQSPSSAPTQQQTGPQLCPISLTWVLSPGRGLLQKERGACSRAIRTASWYVLLMCFLFHHAFSIRIHLFSFWVTWHVKQTTKKRSSSQGNSSFPSSSRSITFLPASKARALLWLPAHTIWWSKCEAVLLSFLLQIVFTVRITVHPSLFSHCWF